MFYLNLQSQNLPSPLNRGEWVKFSVTDDGVYKIDYNQLQSAGIDPKTINPKYIQLYSNGVGMLPQSNSASRINRLQELSIMVVGESDNIFDASDYILFYGQNPDIVQYDIQNDIFKYENHLYSDRNFYFLTIGNNDGKRVVNSPYVEGTYPIINTYNDFVYHELEEYNMLNSGRQWFGEQFSPSNEIILSFNLPGIISSASTQIVSSVVATSPVASSFQLSLNGKLIASQYLDPTPISSFGIKGRQKIDTFSIPPSAINTTEELQQFSYKFVANTSDTPSSGYLDFLLITLERTLSMYGNQTAFRTVASLSQPISTFKVNEFPFNGIIWDVTNPFECMNQAYTIELGKAIFSTTTSELKNFIATSTNELLRPKTEGKIANQNIYVDRSVNLLIIAHPLFLEEAQRLANHRRYHNGISVLVVTPENVYNDYSGGKQDPTAIRDMAKELSQKGLKNILLFGRSTYDFKNRLDRNTNFVPTYASRNSLNPLKTYSSDDYFTFLEPLEGEWAELNITTPHTLDVGVGRLPVKTQEEAKTVVDKLIAYDVEARQIGVWRKEILFVADDGDRNLHQDNADALAEQIETNHPTFNTQKIYLDAFPQLSKPSGQTSPEARKALEKALEKGVLIVNFTGHGSEEVWLQERILDEVFIDEWENDKAYPLLLTATCEFGRNDNPYQISSGEKALLKSGGGAIALITATRPVNSVSNALLNKAFYNALFKKENGKYRDIGTIFREMKNNSTYGVGVSNRNFSLLGDPSMHLAIPENEVVTTYIRTNTGSDTLKALSKVIIKGEVQLQGMKASQFNGTLNVVLKDKPSLFHTLEDPVDENTPFSYFVRSNTLFRGEASITDGMFQVEFIMPENTAPVVGNGKLSLYAVDDTGQHDATGGSIDFKVGGKETNTDNDRTPPSIQLFIGDETFIDGGITSADIQIIAMLSDQHGINIANYNNGNVPTITLDGEYVFEVGEYYLASKYDPTKGSITFPLRGLSPGDHTIELKVWDVYNNFSSSTLDFRVTHSNKLVINQLINYPNPFIQSTRMQFTHNRPGDDLIAFTTIVDLMGRVVSVGTYNITASPYTVILPEWQSKNMRGEKLNSGIYVLRLVVRSLEDGTKNEKSIKLILLE